MNEEIWSGPAHNPPRTFPQAEELGGCGVLEYLLDKQALLSATCHTIATSASFHLGLQGGLHTLLQEELLAMGLSIGVKAEGTLCARPLCQTFLITPYYMLLLWSVQAPLAAWQGGQEEAQRLPIGQIIRGKMHPAHSSRTFHVLCYCTWVLSARRQVWGAQCLPPGGYAPHLASLASVRASGTTSHPCCPVLTSVPVILESAESRFHQVLQLPEVGLSCSSSCNRHDIQHEEPQCPLHVPPETSDSQPHILSPMSS